MFCETEAKDDSKRSAHSLSWKNFFHYFTCRHRLNEIINSQEITNDRKTKLQPARDTRARLCLIVINLADISSWSSAASMTDKYSVFIGDSCNRRTFFFCRWRTKPVIYWTISLSNSEISSDTFRVFTDVSKVGVEEQLD